MKILITKSPGDIIVEKQEQILGDFDGDGRQELMGVDTGSHASGQDQQLSVPDSAFVFSDTQALKIKDKDVLKEFGKTKASTPAKLAKPYDLQAASKMMQDPTNDKLSKKTGEMMYNNYLSKLTKIADIQESMKADKEQKKMMKMGGKVPQYPTGGPYNGYYGYPDVQANQQDMIAQNPQTAWFAQNVMGNPSAGRMDDNMNGYRTQFLNAANSSQQGYPQRQYIDPITPADLSPNGLADTTEYPTPWAGGPSTGNTQGIGSTPSSSGTGSGNKRRVRISGMTADTLGDIGLALKAGSLRKFKPWEPPITAVIPESVYMDPTRELAANSEQATIASNAAANSGNSKAARSATSSYQGQAINNAANILGRYNNANIQIANQVAANITNEKLDKERERAKSLNSDIFNANRLYQRELNQLSDEIVKRAYEKEDKNRNIAWINQTNPYYQLDSRGFPVFNSENTKASYMRMFNGQSQPTGTGDSYKLLKQEYEKAIAAGLDDDTAQEAAWKTVYGARERTTYDKNNMVKSKTVSGPKTKKMGGFTTNQLRNFIEGRGGY